MESRGESKQMPTLPKGKEKDSVKQKFMNASNIYTNAFSISVADQGSLELLLSNLLPLPTKPENRINIKESWLDKLERKREADKKKGIPKNNPRLQRFTRAQKGKASAVNLPSPPSADGENVRLGYE